ncbi:MAG: ComEC family competence protein [Bacteroidales bacterium]|jgi:competence protein ComEC|nr:ComEC family competence protein [Bacteroidales bacterium]
MQKRPIIFILIAFLIAILIVEASFDVFFIRNHYSKHLKEKQYYTLLIKSEGEKKNKTIVYKAKIIKYFNNNSWENSSGDVLVYFPKEDSNSFFRYGDLIITNAPLKEIENLYSNSTFDYKRMMQRKRIYHNVFIGKNYWKKVGENKGNSIIRTAKKVNHFLKERLINSNLKNDESNLAIAMLLSDKTSLDDITIKKYSALGLSHILCVSGLHIGIILFFINFILKFIPFFNYRLILLKDIFLVLIAFSICFIVGLTPSSFRVATFLSILIIVKHFGLGRADSINTLFLTALVFLIADPLLLFNLSFQFSFLAVLGIIVFTPLRNRIQNHIDKIFFLKPFISAMLLTLSAQFFVLPLIIYYFHSFSPFFIIANMLIVPFLSIILLSILLFLIFAKTPLIGDFLTTILHYELSILQFIVNLF